ncbi:unnamed protein product [Peronospora effusa]|nr:unnamed protein product [Peronospora effusa]
MLELRHRHHSALPEAKGLDASWNEFSEDRARIILEQIMTFRYRLAGTKANEEVTPTYLLEQVDLIDNARNKSRQLSWKMCKSKSMCKNHRVPLD